MHIGKLKLVSNSFEKSGLKPYIDMNSDVTKEAKNDFEKKKFKLRNNVVFAKLWKICEKEILNLS